MLRYLNNNSIQEVNKTHELQSLTLLYASDL